MVCSVPSTLKEAAACNDKLIGAALAASHLNDGTYTTAANEHNYATPENEMKWDTVEGQQGQFNFGPGDQIVAFAAQNNLKVKGHTLEQEQLYHDIVAACVAEPLCTAITMWGITDKYSWVNSFNESGCNGQSAHALLWDDNYTKKGSYNAVVKALTGQ